MQKDYNKPCMYCGSYNTLDRRDGILDCKDCNSFSCLNPLNGQEYLKNYHAYNISWLRPKIYYLLLKALKCGLKRNLTIADLGCGAGHALYWAKKYKCTTIGYDIAESFNYIKNADKFYSNLESLSKFEKNTCDLVWCWHTIEHSENPLELIKLAHNILKPGGKAYFEFPESTLMFKAFPFNVYKNFSFPEHRGIPSGSWVYSAFENMSFKNINITYPSEGRWFYLDRKSTRLNSSP